ncbi:2-keto-4-pentenoate hydratase [Actinoplanes sp. URMC 104]|uniref:2-keto-4-pentenoate hydratase n=1 Tax=Actinoplanes sp. URMC 104 TaxID=3423409 RepID=UPI003F1D2D0F
MTDPAEIARVLAAAQRDRRDRAPFTDDHPDLDEAAAYDAQWAGITARLEAGERLVGAKLGLTSRAKQQVMKVDSPLYGWVTSAMLLPYGEPLDRAGFIHPRAEPEIAFLLARDVTTPATVTSVLAATEAVFAAVDVLDSRYTDFRFRLPDVIADNASAGAFLLGPVAVPPSALEDLRLLGVVLRVNGEVVATAAGAAVMGHPAASVAWLANRLAARDQRLSAGMLVFSGGLTEPVPLTEGAAVTAEFEALGTVEVTTRRS